MVQLVKEYGNYLENLKKQIKESGYKTSFFIEKLGVPKASFYRKLREKTFTIEEVKQITRILYPKQTFKEELLQSIEQGREEIRNGNTFTSNELKLIAKTKNQEETISALLSKSEDDLKDRRTYTHTEAMRYLREKHL